MKKGDKIIVVQPVGELLDEMIGVCLEAPAKDKLGIGRFNSKEICFGIENCSVVDESALATQQGGTHYKDLKIQPIEYIHANKLGYIEGNIVKYITRHKEKNGAEDIKKIIHYCELLLELEYK